MIAWFKRLLHRHKWEFIEGDWVPGHKDRVSQITRGCKCGLRQRFHHYKEFGIDTLDKEWRV